MSVFRTRARSTQPATDADGGAAVAGVTGPAGVEVAGRWLRVGDGYAASLAVTGYPAEVGPAWLEPLLCWPGRLDVAVHIDPIPTADAAARLRRQRARLESSRRLDADKGRLNDPVVDAAADAAAELADRLARGAARLFRVGLYLTVHAPTRDELADAVGQVRAAAASVLLDTQPATWRQLQAWTSTLPLGTDSVRMRRVFDTDSLAAMFPLASADLPAPLPGDRPPAGGVLYGLNTDSAGVVWWDRWSLDNHNSVVLARSGAGKSYLVKLDLLRSLYDGVQAAVIDPEDEYVRLAQAVGGATVQLGAAGVRVNPLDRPLAGCYAAAGISNDPASWGRPAPLLRDLTSTLDGGPDPAGRQLAARLAPWVSGSFRGLFDGPTTTTHPAGHLVVWSTRQLPDELRAPGMLLALDAVWRDVDTPAVHGQPAGRRLVVVDEAWTLLKDGEGARFLYRLAKAARKRQAGLAVVTQDAADLLGSDLGQAVVANAATQILMRQAPQAIDLIADTFALTAGEARRLLSARRGEALLLAGSVRASFLAVSSPAEHRLAAGLADLDDPDL